MVVGHKIKLNYGGVELKIVKFESEKEYHARQEDGTP